jgi:hypothetical protein
MGFWETFVKVWQVRTSIKIQESFEETYRTSKNHFQKQSNISMVVDELDKKNKSWDEKIEYHRIKSSKQ